MVTFNVDSLDFVDDEEVRTGDAQEFASRYSSSNDRLEIEDLTAGTVAHAPRGTATDLVGGKFAETVSEGKALADDGNVYDTIQQAVNAASSWVKVGPGSFNGRVTISTAGLTLEGSGERTKVKANNSNTITVAANNISIANLSIVGGQKGISPVLGGVDNIKIQNVTIRDTNGEGIDMYDGDAYSSSSWTVSNCTIVDIDERGMRIANSSRFDNNTVARTSNDGVYIRGGNVIVSNNTFSECEASFRASITAESNGNDTIIYGNIVTDSGNLGINNFTDGTIIVNNRIANSTNANISDDGTGTLVQDNITT